jgi:NADP-dependent 3-hydroxy acid dehydrogenase YdfG
MRKGGPCHEHSAASSQLQPSNDLEARGALLTISLINHVAVVTGAGGGIGRAIAKALAAEGAILCLVGRTQATLEETADAVRPAAARVMVSPVDLTLDHLIEELRNRLETEFGRVDILVHSAGLIVHGKIESHSAEDLDRQYHANVRAPYLLTQLLLPLLKVNAGQVVAINSSVGLRAPAGAAQFSATQHALKALTDSLREEINAYGIRVLNVFPGRTATPRQAALYKLRGQNYCADLLLQPDDIASIIIASLALARTAEVTEIHIRPLIKSY